MTPPSDLQEEIERRVAKSASRDWTDDDYDSVRAALRELAAWCYRDAEREARQVAAKWATFHSVCPGAVNEAAEAIARRAKDG